MVSKRYSVLDVLKELWRFRETMILILTPLVTLPLLLTFPGDQIAQAGYVLIIMAVYWMTESLPLAATALIPLIAFPMFGIIEADEISLYYFKDTNILVIGGLMMAVAIESHNLHKRIALSVLMLFGSNPRWLMLGFMLPTAFLSMWISNTASTAMMVPIAEAVLAQMFAASDTANEKEREYEDTDVDALRVVPSETGFENSALEIAENGGKDFGTFQDQPDSEKPLGNGHTDAISDQFETTFSSQDNFSNVALSEINPKVNRDEDEESEPVVTMKPLSQMTQRQRNITKALLLCVPYSANIGGTATITGTGTNPIMNSVLKTSFGSEAETLSFAEWFFFAIPGMLIFLVIAWIWLQLFLIDRNCHGCKKGMSWERLISSCPCSNKQRNSVGRAVIVREYNKLGKVSFAEVSAGCWFLVLATLWLTYDLGDWGWNYLFGEYASDATAGMIVTVAMFMWPAKMPTYFCFGEKQNVEKGERKPRKGLLTWNKAQSMIPWNVIILLGGGFALAEGCEKSQLSAWLGCQLSVVLGDLDAVWVVLIVTTFITFFTEVTSNTAIASIFLPILANMAVSLHIHPIYLMLPATIACSFAFMLPVATPPNAIAFSHGQLSVSDMASAGLVLNLLGIGMVNMAINLWGNSMFDLDEFPAWASGFNETNNCDQWII